MDILRRNTDYALRAMVNLARHWGKQLLSVRQLTSDGNFPYPLGCKILQKLARAKLVESHMGAGGGFRLAREPSKITLIEIIGVLQGGIRLNRCLLGTDACEFEHECEISIRLACLQSYIDGYLGGITLAEIVENIELAEKRAGKRISQKREAG